MADPTPSDPTTAGPSPSPSGMDALTHALQPWLARLDGVSPAGVVAAGAILLSALLVAAGGWVGWGGGGRERGGDGDGDAQERAPLGLCRHWSAGGAGKGTWGAEARDRPPDRHAQNLIIFFLSLSPPPAILGRGRARTAGVRSRASGPLILIAGPSGAGKTTLFLRLRDGAAAPASLLGSTVSSLAENEAPGAAGGACRGVALVDAPGHPRLRALAASHAPAAAALVFVVDAASFLAGKAEAADQLVSLLRAGLGRKAGRRRGRASPGGGGTPILLACNKANLGAAAYSPDFIRKRLEREVEAGRGAAGETLAPPGEDGEGPGGGGGDALALSPPGQPFTFDGLAQMGGGRLTAVACAAGTGDVAAVEAWLAAQGF